LRGQLLVLRGCRGQGNRAAPGFAFTWVIGLRRFFRLCFAGAVSGGGSSSAKKSSWKVSGMSQ
jgi:hypothetical protein